MPIKIVVPQLGESVAEGTVSKWLKAVGDRVRKEEPLVEIQTDKINVEIPAPAEGTLEKILVQEGTTVLVGTEIGQLSGSGEDVAAPAQAAGSGQAARRWSSSVHRSVRRRRSSRPPASGSTVCAPRRSAARSRSAPRPLRSSPSDP